MLAHEKENQINKRLLLDDETHRLVLSEYRDVIQQQENQIAEAKKDNFKVRLLLHKCMIERERMELRT